MTNTLITGGAGYIGSRLVEHLLYECNDVYVLDISKDSERILAPFKGNPKFHLNIGDITDKDTVSKALKNIDRVIHLAAVSGFEQCKEDPKRATEINVEGTKNLIELATESDAKRLIYASTCSAYGDTSGEFTDELSKVTPISHYGKTKHEAEGIVLENNSPNLETIALRFATATGISYNMRWNLLPAHFVKDAVEGKDTEIKYWDSYRPYIHLLDIMQAISSALTANPKKVAGEIFNVADESQNYTKEDLIKMIQSHYEGWQPTFDTDKKTGDKRNYRTHGKKIERVLGFKKTISIEMAIAEMISFLKQN